MAFGPVTLQVGPGVFIPRPETEAMLEWACTQQLGAGPVIVDLCTGSGALAVALARHWPHARVIAVDDSETAVDYARRNAAGTAAEVVLADVTAPACFLILTVRSTSWWPTRPISRTVLHWKPKWLNMIHHTRCSGPRWDGGDRRRGRPRRTVTAPGWSARRRARRRGIGANRRNSL
ncbi:methyltransferase domain protein [Mycobacterium xenopi 3993]|nr:methyltransferase domain protein [Mycobacterium xenopi 3993]